MCLNSVYHLLIWCSRLWNSELDVQRRLLCFLVTSFRVVGHYISRVFSDSANYCSISIKIRIIRIFLPHLNIFHSKKNPSDMSKTVYFTACKLLVILVLLFIDRYTKNISNLMDIHPMGANSFPSADGQRNIINWKFALQFCERADIRRISWHSGS
jgi:hypothetical protein